MYSNTDKRNRGKKKKTQTLDISASSSLYHNVVWVLFWLLPFLLIVCSESLLKQTSLHFPTCTLLFRGILSLADVFFCLPSSSSDES